MTAASVTNINYARSYINEKPYKGDNLQSSQWFLRETDAWKVLQKQRRMVRKKWGEEEKMDETIYHCGQIAFELK